MNLATVESLFKLNFLFACLRRRMSSSQLPISPYKLLLIFCDTMHSKAMEFLNGRSNAPRGATEGSKMLATWATKHCLIKQCKLIYASVCIFSVINSSKST